MRRTEFTDFPFDKEAFKELYNICDVIIPNTGDLMTVVDKVYSVISSEEEGNEQQWLVSQRNLPTR